MLTTSKGSTLSQSYFGLHRTTLIDFPHEVAATVFIPGCNLRCPYCHNPEMVLSEADRSRLVAWDTLRDFITARKKLLGGICITGGEPLLYPALRELISFIEGSGLKVKLDTNGTFPERLPGLRVDYIAMDIKTDPGKYNLLGGRTGQEKALEESIRWIMASGIAYEFRTTVVPGIVDISDVIKIARLLKGAGRYILSQFRPGITLDPAYAEHVPYPVEVLREMQQAVQAAGVNCILRSGSRETGNKRIQ